jgi:hypothetical protein
MALVALAACGGTMWREADIQRVEPQQHLFVVTTGKAYVLEVAETTNEVLRGTPVRVWSFEPREFVVRETESPDDTAQRLGWTTQSPDGAPREIRIADIRYASTSGPGIRASRVAGGVGFLAVVVLAVGALVVVAVGASLGGHR